MPAVSRVSDKIVRHEIRPTPTDDELAAIMAALDKVWPDTETRPSPPESSAPSRWRFAGRWWSKPVPLHRERPW
jgi:hypothetical protein